MASLEDITARLNIEQIFTTFGLIINKQRGKQWECRCPFCQDPKHFSVNPQKGGLWKCHKCGESGNLVTFVAKTQNITTGEAFKRLAEMAGLEPEMKSRQSSQKKTENAPKVVELKPNPKEGTTRNPSGKQTIRNIYERFIALTTLTDIHRQQLKDKRGFTLNTIETFKLRSGGPQVEGIFAKLQEEFAVTDLYASGLMVEVNGCANINAQLLDDRVLIPYLDERGLAYHLRPHKLGFQGIPSEVFSRFLLKERPEHVVITEGEFKAIALWQWGIPALAVPGVSSFGAKNLDRLVDLLREYGVKSVTVVFDNEIKDNPAYPNFKEKAEDRYDTQFWSYMMAYKLERSGFIARVGWLPDGWRQNGKIDFDGALAQGHTREEIQAVIDGALTHKEYLDSLPEEALRIVKRKIARHFARVDIHREFNKYVATRRKGGETYEETISNFVINIKSSFYTPDGVIRNVELVNEYGEISETFPLEPGNMAGLNEFKKFCFSKGNYVFEGSAQDLLNIWKLEFLRDTGDLIYMPDRIGLIENNIWLFGNMAIKDGKVYRPDNDGIVWIEGKGYKPQSLQIGARGETIEDAIPALSDRPVDIADIAQKLKEAVGGYEAYMGIGWVVATIFSKDIFELYKCMPILFPHGKRESGKSTFMRWIMSFFGIETEGIGIAETTQNFIARALSYYSSLGCWFDEYRNEPRVTQKDGFFRSAYNRQLSGKGTATAFQARGFAVHAAVAISGEELPRDNGLFTRCIPLQMSAYRRDRTWYDWLNRQAGRFSGFTYWLLTHYEELKPKILASIAELKEALLAKEVSDRTAENWAICAGAFDAAVLANDDFIRWVERTCQEIKRAGEEEHMLNQFWEDLSYLASEGEIGSKHCKVEGNKFYIWLQGAYEAWAIHYRKKTGREPFDRLSIQKYLQEEPYFLSAGNLVRLNGPAKRTCLIDLNSAPDVIKELAATIMPLMSPGEEQEF